MIYIIIQLLLVAYIFANCLYKRTNAYKNSYVTIKGYLQGVPKNLRIVAFGSTYAKYAFNNFEELRLNGFNFCLEAEALQSDFRLMKQYETHLAPGCIVVINLAACVTCCNEEEVVVLYANNYYKILPFKMLPKVLRYSFKRWWHYVFPIGLKNLKQFGRLIIDTDCIDDVASRHPVSVTASSANENMENIANGWIQMFKLEDLKSIDIPKKIEECVRTNEHTLNEMVAFCKSKEWKPLFVIPPMSSKLYRNFSDEFVEKVLLSVANKCSHLNNIPLYNYLKQEEFYNDYNLYCDGGFRLNKYGSKKFMRHFFSDLIKDGIIANNSVLSVDKK